MSWEEFLNPEILRLRLVTASLYIAAFQLLKNSIVDRTRNFYTMGFENNKIFRNYESHFQKYQSEVLARNRSPVYASLDWLKDSQAISDDDVAVFESVKKLRNQIAHAFSRMLTKGLPSDLPKRFNEMVSLLDKIERWWIVNVDIAVDPEFPGNEIDEDAIIPGPIIGLQLMVDIALGPPELSKKYLDDFIRLTRHVQ